jgi:hypothetical protein
MPIRQAKNVLNMTLLFWVPLGAVAQNTVADSKVVDHLLQAGPLADLRKQAELAHSADRYDDEIVERQQFSRDAWAAVALNPKASDEYDRYDIVFLNDLSLGLLLEGTHRFSEAESIFRHNQVELNSERIAGNDIKSDNQLLLAHLLLKEGKDAEARSICSHWKHRMRHLAAGQDNDYIYGTPQATYDTPQIEVARWDLACGSPDEGLKLIGAQIAAHPHMLVSFTVLSDYYYAQGDFQGARKAELDGTAAVTGRQQKPL